MTLPPPSLSLLLDAGVDTKSTGKALGGLLANLKAGRGLFGEEATMKAVGKITETIEQVAWGLKLRVAWGLKLPLD